MRTRRFIEMQSILYAAAGPLALTAVVALAPPSAQAALIFGPGDPPTGTSYGALFQQAPPWGNPVGNGVAIGNFSKGILDISTGKLIGQGTRGIRWDASGHGVELGTLETRTNGSANVYVTAVNATGTAAGKAEQYVGGISAVGERAVRWDASGTAATELGNLGTDGIGFTNSSADAINAAGTAVGSAVKYVGGADRGYRAVRWAAGGTAATELGHIGTGSSGVTNSHALAINASGLVVGDADKFTGGVNIGPRAVRWNASGTVATELGHIGTDSSGYTSARALAVNDTGTAVGVAFKYIGGVYKSGRAVRWNASGTAATELGNLGANSTGDTYSFPTSINAAGTTVGYAARFVGGFERGYRAVRWDASGIAATELGYPANVSDLFGNSNAFSINDTGIAVGYIEEYNDNAIFIANHAVAWGTNGVAIDLRTLLDSGSGWVSLTEAHGISNTNWITGYGVFDPDGSGPRAAYTSMFLLDGSALVPEPAAIGLVALAGLTLLRRRRPAGVFH